MEYDLLCLQNSGWNTIFFTKHDKMDFNSIASASNFTHGQIS